MLVSPASILKVRYLLFMFICVISVEEENELKKSKLMSFKVSVSLIKTAFSNC